MKLGTYEHQLDIMRQDRGLETISLKSRPAANFKEEPVSELKIIDKRMLDFIIVFITMGKGRRYAICQMVDFVIQGSSSSIIIKNLLFNQFISILEEEIQFEPARHQIVYCYTKRITVPITNEYS
jgi:hypothetical protein